MSRFFRSAWRGLRWLFAPVPERPITKDEEWWQAIK